MPSVSIRPITVDDLPILAAHGRRHHAENGVDGNVIFSVVEHFDEERYIKNRREGLEAALGTRDWERLWAAFDGSSVVGVVELCHPGLPQCHHRARLSIGLEGPYRGDGVGLGLMQVALEWSRAEASIDWVELGVFADNVPAQRLYDKLGFKVTGRINDLFRVKGVSVDDIQMSLFVGAEPRS